MRIAFPFANQYAGMAGLLQGGAQAQDKSQERAMQLMQQKLAERAQAHREKNDAEQLGFERFKFGEGYNQQRGLEQMRSGLAGDRETADRTWRSGEGALERGARSTESALERAMREKLADLQERGSNTRQGAQITSQEKEGRATRVHATRLAGDERFSRESMADDQRAFEGKWRGEELGERRAGRTAQERHQGESIGLQREALAEQIAARGQAKELHEGDRTEQAAARRVSEALQITALAQNETAKYDAIEKRAAQLEAMGLSREDAALQADIDVTTAIVDAQERLAREVRSARRGK